MKNLFIPLKTEFYERFERKEKKVEYRLYGPRWNEKNCPPGRPVTLSKGYGKANRMAGSIRNFRRVRSSLLPPSVQVSLENIYGPGEHDIACIGIDIGQA